jgi:metallo-beta-lactamase family protein
MQINPAPARFDEARTMKIRFLGGAGTVTGSKYLVEHAGHSALIDCGLFQGYKNLRLRNWALLPFDAGKLDAVVLTHAHLDHSGALPLLMRQGFRGPVHTSAATIELCQLLLPDSGHIQEEDAAFANRHRTSKHEPALPLYTAQEARDTLPLLAATPFDEWRELMPGVRMQLRMAGHILGAASVALATDDCTVLFSGDLGRPDDPVMRPPAPIAVADFIVIESTYGDRVHDAADVEGLIGETIVRTVKRGGTVVVPSFAVGRAQALLHIIHRLKASGAIPDVPVFLDSPMAVDATAIYRRFGDQHRLSPHDCEQMFRVATMVRSVDESRALNALRYPAVIISASGMATGGRVLHHLKTRAGDHRNTILFAGFQAPGTRGARLLAGERLIRIFGEDIAVNAEVVNVQGLSAHADAPQLLAWLRTCPKAPRSVFVTHGEPGAADALRQRIENEVGWRAHTPWMGDTADLSGAKAAPHPGPPT